MLNIFNQNNTDFIEHINGDNFDNIALQVYDYQYENCAIYKQYVDLLRISPLSVKSVDDIPFLPISFFKSHKVVSTTKNIELVFESSGTTGQDTSKHYVADADLYEKSLIRGFEEQYGAINGYTVLALLPSYLERSNASLVHMVRVLMEHSGRAMNGFFLNNHKELANTLEELKKNNEKVVLVGVTFALLDFAEAYSLDLSGMIIMETGGMKGRRQEMTREQVHKILKSRFGLKYIHSEYGMTELLSQGYSKKDGIYHASSTMKVFIRDINDPFDVRKNGSGLLNIVDLANLNSCSFIATEDIGKVYADSSFEVIGRVDNSALRGCNLMIV